MASWLETCGVNAVDFDLYLVTDRNQTGGRDLLWVLHASPRRRRESDPTKREGPIRERFVFAGGEVAYNSVRPIDAALFINDRVDVAMAVDATGVQLSKASLPIATARALLGPQKIIGVSTHSLQETKEAEQAGADFVLFGPVYFTPSKAAYGAPQGLPALKAIVDNISVPVYAIGGIKLENIDSTKKLGVRGVALISAIVSADSPKEAAKRMLRQLRN